MNTKHVIESSPSNPDQTASEGLVLLDFWAPWCGPCRMMAPVLEQIEREIDGLRVEKISVDENPSLAAQFSVQSIPLLVLMKDGEEVTRFVGVQPIPTLVEAILRHQN